MKPDRTPVLRGIQFCSGRPANKAAPIDIIGRNGGASIAIALTPSPSATFAPGGEPKRYILAERRTVALVCRRYLNGAPNLRRCDLFECATGSDDELGRLLLSAARGKRRQWSRCLGDKLVQKARPVTQV